MSTKEPTATATTATGDVVAALPSRTLRALGDVETVARVVREVFDASDFHDAFNEDAAADDEEEETVVNSKTTTPTTSKWMPLVDALKTRTSVDAAREALRIGMALSRGKRARVDAEGVGGRMTTTMKPTTSSRVDRLGEGLVTCARCSRAVYADLHAEHLKYRCDGGASAVGRDATLTKSTTKSTATTTTMTTGGVVVQVGMSDTAPRERAKSASVAASSAKQRQNAAGAASASARHAPTPLAVRVSASDARRAHDAIVFAGMCRAKTKIGDAFAEAAVRDDT